MKIVVCIRQGIDGEINPFDASAYEEALKIDGAEIILLSMGALSAKDFLYNLTRLGASRAILLSDRAFAGADTLATAYTLSRAIERISPDLIFCGRQTVVGDTGQVGPMLSVMAKYNLITNVMAINELTEKKIVCNTRDEGIREAAIPALLTVERISTLRFPKFRSRLGEIEVWDADDLSADKTRIGLVGSPTRVMKTFENASGKRKCKFVSYDELDSIIEEALNKNREIIDTGATSNERLGKVLIVGDKPRAFAESVSDNVKVLDFSSATELAQRITEENPDAVLWGSDSISKRLCAEVAAILGLGLCADCTALDVESGELIMYRPALSGSIIAKIRSNTRPAMATVRTESGKSDIVVALGYGAKDCIDSVLDFANRLSADVGSSRKLVDEGLMHYATQVGLTGRTVSPPLYIAIGVSGAVHHIVGMQRSGTVIAINPDKDAPIFEYADYGIISNFDKEKTL